MKCRLLLLATALCLLVPDAFAQSKVPSLINYQGNVRNAAGVPIGSDSPDNRTVTFRFYKSPTSVLAADRLWSESQTVTILDGNFNVLIGNGTPVGAEANAVTPFANVFSQSTSVYLGITVDDRNSGTVDAEISPRQQLVSGAFAFRATVAESVDNQAITTGMLAGSSVTANQLGTAAVTTAKIDNSAVTNDKIQNGTIQEGKLANGSVTSAKILDGTIVSTDIAADTITAGNIAPGAVASSEILNGSIEDVDIKDSAVTTTKIGPAAVTTEKIASGVNLAAGTLSTTGNVTIGANGGATTLKVNNKPVPVAEENLRIVRGSISQKSTTGVMIVPANYTTLTPMTKGTGWFLNGLSAPSHYRKVVFSPPFSDTPTITAAAKTEYTDQNEYANYQPMLRNVTKDGFEITIANGYYYSTTWNYAFFPFLPVDFIAVGPR